MTIKETNYLIDDFILSIPRKPLVEHSYHIPLPKSLMYPLQANSLTTLTYHGPFASGVSHYLKRSSLVIIMNNVENT